MPSLQPNAPRYRGSRSLQAGLLAAAALAAAPLAVAAIGDDPRQSNVAASDSSRAPDLLFSDRQPKFPLEDCGGDLLDCPNLLILNLRTQPTSPAPEGPVGPASDIVNRHWLVQAKIVVIGQDLPRDRRNDCGLVIDGSIERSGVLDRANSRLAGDFDPGEFETVALSAVVPQRLKNPVIALRCTSRKFNDSFASNLKMTAVEVGTITKAG
jgi:hypothetical protein